mgnify:CR=1 FL=1
MRLVIANGAQYDADNLPPHIDAADCVPAEQWFAENATGRAKAEPVSEVPAAPKRKRRT